MSKAVEKLIERYETISIEEIKEVFEKTLLYKAKAKLTGFGRVDKCMICAEAKQICVNCFFAKLEKNKAKISVSFPCVYNNKSRPTYIAIKKAETPEELLTAYRNRAIFLKSIL